MAITTNMNLTTWGPNDYFNDLDLKTNWEKVDAHDHDPANDGGVRIGANGIANGAITNVKLGDAAVTDSKIANDTITKFKLANDLVVALDKAAEALSIDTVFGSDSDSDVRGDVGALKIRDNVIVDTHISETAQIKPSKIEIRTQSGAALSEFNGVVDTNASAGGEVTGPFNALAIGNGAVTTSKLGTSAVTADKINTGAVTSAKILDNTIVKADLNAEVSNELTGASKAWTAYNPVLTALGGSVNDQTSKNGSAYQKIHNTMNVRIVTTGTWIISGSSALLISLPAAAVGKANGVWRIEAGFSPDFGVAYVDAGNSSVALLGLPANYTGGTPSLIGGAANNNGGAFYTITGSSTVLSVSLTYEVA